jgi:hypothetical protein
LFEESRANATLSVVVVVVVVVVVGADLVVLCLQHWAEKKETKEIKQANKQARKKEIRVWLARSCCCGRLSSSRVRRRFGVAERASIIHVSKAKVGYSNKSKQKQKNNFGESRRERVVEEQEINSKWLLFY